MSLRISLPISVSSSFQDFSLYALSNLLCSIAHSDIVCKYIHKRCSNEAVMIKNVTFVLLKMNL
jgi:hypothetical protein